MGIFKGLFGKLFSDPFFEGLDDILKNRNKNLTKAGINVIRMRIKIRDDRKFGRLLKQFDLTHKEADSLMLFALDEINPYKEENNGQKKDCTTK
jgi:hypothetical protein